MKKKMVSAMQYGKVNVERRIWLEVPDDWDADQVADAVNHSTQLPYEGENWDACSGFGYAPDEVTPMESDHVDLCDKTAAWPVFRYLGEPIQGEWHADAAQELDGYWLQVE